MGVVECLEAGCEAGLQTEVDADAERQGAAEARSERRGGLLRLADAVLLRGVEEDTDLLKLSLINVLYDRGR